MTYVCLLTENRYSECWNCGGSRTAEGGPFVTLEGPTKFCSEGCWEDSIEYAARMDALLKKWFDICNGCGFDNDEHDDYCGWLQVVNQ